MGIEIDREEFSADDEAAFDARLRSCVDTLRGLLATPGFGCGPATIGAELELDLVDDVGRPALVAPALLAARGEKPWAAEIDRFNLEVNYAPLLLGGRPFAALKDAIASSIDDVAAAAAAHGARPVAIGLLPTLLPEDLGVAAMSPGRRYAAVAKALKRRHGGPFAVHIEGRDDAVRFEADEVSVEGASTSFQVHLRVDPAAYARTYNAAQLAVAPALAVAANAPLLFGRRLWDETRIALYRQSVDERPLQVGVGADDDWRPSRVSFGHGFARDGALELFAEAVGLHAPLLPVLSAEDPTLAWRRFVDGGAAPRLVEMGLHKGTVWHWNRAIYDDSDGGHLRIEFRALPAGPTPVDMAANAALQLGLTLALADDIDELLASLTFGHARRNFYAAARFGLDAELVWPQGPARRPRLVSVREVLGELLPRAADALLRAGVFPDDVEAALSPIEGRLTTGQTGARWLAAAALGADGDMADVVSGYLRQADTGAPVHTWR